VVSFIGGGKKRVPRENHRPTARHWQICIEYTSASAGFEFTTSVVIGIDCTGSCKSNHHMIMITTTPVLYIFNTKRFCI